MKMMKYEIALYDIEDKTRCFLIYKSSICPQLGTSIYFPHIGIYNVEKIVYVVSDDRPRTEREELLYIDVIVSKGD